MPNIIKKWNHPETGTELDQRLEAIFQEQLTTVMQQEKLGPKGLEDDWVVRGNSFVKGSELPQMGPILAGTLQANSVEMNGMANTAMVRILGEVNKGIRVLQRQVGFLECRLQLTEKYRNIIQPGEVLDPTLSMDIANEVCKKLYPRLIQDETALVILRAVLEETIKRTLNRSVTTERDEFAALSAEELTES